MSKRLSAVLALMLVAVGVACGRGIRVTSFEIDGHPSALTTVGNHVWVADDRRHAIHVLDARTGDEVRLIDVSRNPIAIAAGGGSVWVAHADGRLAAIDARTHRVRELIEVGGSLTGATYAFDRVWVTDLEHDDLIEVDPEDLEVADRIGIEAGAVRVVAGAGRSLWVTNREDTVTEVVDGRVNVVRKVGSGPIGLAYDGRTLWVANSDDDSVSVLRDGSVRDDVPAGRGPIGVAAFADEAWAVNQDDGTLTPLNRREAPPIEVGTQPRGAVAVEWFGHREIWVVGSNPDAVVRVEL